jgi:hypothetical protein
MIKLLSFNKLKMFNTERQKIILSIILGFGISTLFRKVCKYRNCIIYKSPPVKEIENNIYKYKNKCYKYKTEETKCN